MILYFVYVYLCEGIHDNCILLTKEDKTNYNYKH